MTTVLCHGCFDLLHPGHINHFEKAAALGSRLVVSITSDKWVNKGPGRPIFPEHQRMLVIRGIRVVDAVILSDAENCVGVILKVKPHIFCKGPDYSRGDKTGNLDKERTAVESYGGRLAIIDNDIIYSSTEILSGQLLAKRIKECVS